MEMMEKFHKNFRWPKYSKDFAPVSTSFKLKELKAKHLEHFLSVLRVDGA